MAKITHSCGHTQTHQIYGKHSGFGGREEKIAWLEGRLCTKCWKAEKDEQRAKESAEAAEQAKASGLPELTGSEKQVAWAERIRAEILSEFTIEKVKAWCINAMPPIKSAPDDNDLKSVMKSEFDDSAILIFSEVREQSSAGWWIDRRHTMNVNIYVWEQWKERWRALCPSVAKLIDSEAS